MGEKGQAPSTTGATNTAVGAAAPAAGMAGHIPTQDEAAKMAAVAAASDPLGIGAAVKNMAAAKAAADAASQVGASAGVGAGAAALGASQIGGSPTTQAGGGEKGQAAAASHGSAADSEAADDAKDKFKKALKTVSDSAERQSSTSGKIVGGG